MRFYARLCLEGLPLHLWSERFAAAVLGRSCALHSAEESSRRRESTEVFELVAWTADPVAIPLHLWLTVVDPDLHQLMRWTPSLAYFAPCSSSG
jgi:hypothetical protein